MIVCALLVVFIQLFVSGCGAKSDDKTSAVNNAEAEIKVLTDAKKENTDADIIDRVPETVVDAEENADIQADTNAQKDADTGINEGKKSGSTQSAAVVWLGDSLTQGSLGHENDNLANAPYVKLSEISGFNVEGYGFYGYKTHDIFWVYTDEEHENQKKDPGKIYVFWVGSNDWVIDGITNDDAESVINEIDSFVNGGGITNYLVLGTTARYELRSDYAGYGKAANLNAGTDVYKVINDKLKAHFGDKYLDVNEVIPLDTGYGPDNIHLTQESYDAVARLVYEKLR